MVSSNRHTGSDSVKKGVVTNEMFGWTADEEDEYIVARRHF